MVSFICDKNLGIFNKKKCLGRNGWLHKQWFTSAISFWWRCCLGEHRWGESEPCQNKETKSEYLLIKVYTMHMNIQLTYISKII